MLFCVGKKQERKVTRYRMEAKKEKRCKNGHVFYKSSSCPVCPVCAKADKPRDGFMSQLSAPARRALQNAGIVNLHQLAKYSEAEILSLHGMGPSSLPKLASALKTAGLSFRKIKV